MTEQRRLANEINQARESGQLVYAWPPKFSGRRLVHAAKYSGRKLKVQLSGGVWATVETGDVQFGDVRPVTV